MADTPHDGWNNNGDEESEEIHPVRPTYVRLAPARPLLPDDSLYQAAGSVRLQHPQPYRTTFRSAPNLRAQVEDPNPCLQRSQEGFFDYASPPLPESRGSSILKPAPYPYSLRSYGRISESVSPVPEGESFRERSPTPYPDPLGSHRRVLELASPPAGVPNTENPFARFNGPVTPDLRQSGTRRREVSSRPRQPRNSVSRNASTSQYSSTSAFTRDEALFLRGFAQALLLRREEPTIVAKQAPEPAFGTRAVAQAITDGFQQVCEILQDNSRESSNSSSNSPNRPSSSIPSNAAENQHSGTLSDAVEDRDRDKAPPEEDGERRKQGDLRRYMSKIKATSNPKSWLTRKDGNKKDKDRGGGGPSGGASTARLKDISRDF